MKKLKKCFERFYPLIFGALVIFIAYKKGFDLYSIPNPKEILADVGQVCAKYQHENLKNLSCSRVQCDEIWSFCYSKQKNIPREKVGIYGVGDVWTWVALDADTKLAVTWLVGLRTVECANWFMQDLAGRLTEKIQLTTDGFKVYVNAVERDLVVI